jgi:hypothetical protein
VRFFQPGFSGAQAIHEEGRNGHVEASPDRPSLESLRKQAKMLARDIAAGDARPSHVRGCSAKRRLPLLQRNTTRDRTW